MKNVLLTIFLSLLLLNLVISQEISKYNKVKPNTIILKIKEEYKDICGQKSIDNNVLNIFLTSINVKQINKKFPLHKSPKTKYNKYGNKLVDLSLIYEIEYENKHTKTNKIFNYLNSLNIIEYAEPHYIPQLLYRPNDPDTASQYYLDNLQVYDAWDICKGDTSVVIGITDTGIDFLRDELVSNVNYNYNDPMGNLTDDDNDGYIDNFKGWDIGENDANPQWNENDIPGKNPHGVAVASLPCSGTDDDTAMAGIGFNTRFLPIKISDKDGLLIEAYNGIVYAADHGCCIINCSWGGPFGHYYGQDVINYATYNKNSLVIAAAGNVSINQDLYPASYQNVLSVANTDQNDHKGGSSYGYHIDVAAPGTAVYIAYYDDFLIEPIYRNGWGTSFSSPIVAGCAAIIKAHYDSLNALQIGEVLRITADNIDTIPFNTPYAGLLGSGRVNLYRAVSDTLTPSVRFNNIEYNNNTTTANFQENDTIFIRGKYTNYLAPATNLTATITCMSTNVQIISNLNNIGSLATLDTTNNNTNPFIIKLLPGVNYDEKIIIKISYTDNNYSAFEYFDFVVNASIVNIDTNNIATSLTSIGKIGYENYYPPNGMGFIYKGTYEMLYEAGLMVASSGNNVSDCIRGENDFSIIAKVEQVLPAVVSDFDVNAIFNDDNSNTSPIELEITQNTYAWNDSVSKDFIIVKYDIVNKNTIIIDSLYVGIFADWDINNPFINTIGFNQNNNISYTNSNDGFDLYAGMQLLSGGQLNHYALDNDSGGVGGIDISDGFSTAEKVLALSTSRHNAGQNGNDVVDIISSGPFTLPVGDTLTVAFALHGNIHINYLLEAAANAQAIYDSLFSVGIKNVNTVNNDIEIFPNPTKGKFTVKEKNLSAGQVGIQTIEILDVTGKPIKHIVIAKSREAKSASSAYRHSVDLSSQSKGIYFIKITSDIGTCVRKLIIE